MSTHEIDDKRLSIKKDIWALIGYFFLFLGVGALAVYLNRSSKEEYIELATEPLVGDLYMIRGVDGGYSAIRVAGVKPDSVSIQYNEFRWSAKKMGRIVHKFQKDYGWRESNWVPRSKIITMVQLGEILRVVREKQPAPGEDYPDDIPKMN